MLSKANQLKIQNFEINGKALNQIKHMPVEFIKILTEIYSGKEVKLSYDNIVLAEQKSLMKLGLITIKGKTELVLTEQGKTLCKEHFIPKRKSVQMLKILKYSFISMVVFMVLGALSVGLTGLTPLVSDNSISIEGILTLIFVFLVLIALAMHTWYYYHLYTNCNEISMFALKANLKQFCKNDYRTEFKKFVKNLYDKGLQEQGEK